MKSMLRQAKKEEVPQLKRGDSDTSTFALEPAPDGVALEVTEDIACDDDWTHRSSDDTSDVGALAPTAGSIAEALSAALLGRRKRVFGS